MTTPENEQAAAKCRVQMHDGKPCGRGVYDQEGKCICHSADSDKDAAAMRREIEAMLARKDCDFTAFVFPDGISFRGARFEGESDFGGARFEGDAEFDAATFQGGASFIAARFQGGADFGWARFQGGADFGVATFQGGAFFGWARFQGWADFGVATFQGGADFFHATFQGKAYFMNARFEREVRFTGYGENRVFTSKAEAEFQYARFGQPENVLFQHVFLGRARFLNTDVRRVDFTDVEWARRRGGHCAVWDELAPEDEEKDYALIGKLYRQLKHNYEEQRDPITAGDFHIGEMQMRRLSNPPRGGFRRFLKRNLSFLALYCWISRYGESYTRPLVWLGGVILLFAALFALVPALGLEAASDSLTPKSASSFRAALLHSVMCLILRGDRPFQPAHLAGHYVSVIEGIIGAPIIAMFVLALNRRFKR